jgi:hypothetical protein
MWARRTNGNGNGNGRKNGAPTPSPPTDFETVDHERIRLENAIVQKNIPAKLAAEERGVIQVIRDNSYGCLVLGDEPRPFVYLKIKRPETVMGLHGSVASACCRGRCVYFTWGEERWIATLCNETIATSDTLTNCAILADAALLEIDDRTEWEKAERWHHT